jgi:nucleotide-binding universal stress UspA family protein
MLFSVFESTRVLQILEKFTVKKILIPFDGSDNALRAVQYATALAQEIPSMEFFLLHVLDPVTFKSQAALLPPAELSGADRECHDRISGQPRCALGQCASHLSQMSAEQAGRNR